MKLITLKNINERVLFDYGIEAQTFWDKRKIIKLLLSKDLISLIFDLFVKNFINTLINVIFSREYFWYIWICEWIW